MKAKTFHRSIALLCVLSLSAAADVVNGEEKFKMSSMSPDRASRVHGDLSLIQTEQ